jgi:hypothetical protein
MDFENKKICEYDLGDTEGLNTTQLSTYYKMLSDFFAWNFYPVSDYIKQAFDAFPSEELNQLCADAPDIGSLVHKKNTLEEELAVLNFSPNTKVLVWSNKVSGRYEWTSAKVKNITEKHVVLGITVPGFDGGSLYVPVSKVSDRLKMAS